ncbi:hypothetical protein V5O48_002207 [Marasmius crinis-equi]|uniref:Uncharacterized protein n=1 Tax=Marasmius crinis-equi TaxID=585013 RepID=A0ABR3FW78_9AGAR
MANNDSEVAVSSGISGEQENKPEAAPSVVDLTTEASQSLQAQNDAAVATSSASSPTSNTPTGISEKKDTNPTTTLGQTYESSIQQTRPTLVQLGSGSGVPAQPKRFSAVNINKKFLEKTSTITPISSSTSSFKTASPISRPANASNTTAHPRLITTKLTANPQSSSSPGPGWSRPSSVTPPVAPNSNSTTPNGTKHPAQTPSTTVANTLSLGTPQISPVGKVIQPQPRSAALPAGIHRTTTLPGGTSSNKPAWGNVKAGVGSARANTNDFPTAAEVALGATRTAKNVEAKELEEANKHARMEEDADTFRGVHLDPNAHHWDEMEEDDDNFLGGVIEFGDGRQYKVDSNQTQLPPAEDQSARTALPHDTERDDNSSGVSNIPVSKADRFVDDFDRSWPRTGPTSSPSFGSGELTDAARTPPLTTHSAQHESSKVLFNERSNRLEPYSSSRPATQFKRAHQPDHSPTDSRGPRSSFSQTPSSQNVQLLQKPPNNDGYSHNRKYSGSRGPTDQRRDGHYPQTSPHSTFHNLPHSHSNFSGPKAADGGGEYRGRQQSVMGPPPVPAHALQDTGRQLPPHLPQPPLTVSTSTSFRRDGRASSRESRYSNHSAYPPTASGPTSARAPSQSPSLSHASAAISSPVMDPATMNISVSEIESAKKDLMHSAAERAKQRRQQEEEEREREKERARQKAAEIEKRLAATDKEKQVSTESERAIQVIEEAIKEVKEENGAPPPERPVHQRTPSFKSASSHPSMDPRRVSFSRTPGAPSVVPTAPSSDSVNSWRTRPTVSPTQIMSHSRTTSFTSQPPSALDHAQSLADDPEADLEVVDYSDLGKFVGVQPSEEAEQPVEAEPVKAAPRRAVASDFFDEPTSTTSAEGTKLKPDDRVWRRKETASSSPSFRPSDSAPVITLAEPSSPSKSSLFIKGSVAVKSSVSTSPSQLTRNQRNEAAMHALDDVMSRVKEALEQNGIETREQSSQAEKESPLKRPVVSPSHPKTLSPRERRTGQTTRSPQLESHPTENFLFTCTEPPQSPKPAWDRYSVKLPKVSTPVGNIRPGQLKMFYRIERMRWWELLSFTPRVDGMSGRNLSLNDVLFGRGHASGYQGKKRYFVSLPNSSLAAQPQPQMKPTIPVRMNTGGAFGKPTVADEASTWRKRPSPEVADAVALDTTSRSPPPVPREMATAAVSLEKPKEESLGENAGANSLRLRSQPKMPLGSGVAFYRDSRIVEVDSKAEPGVSFFAISEVDSSSSSTEVRKEAPTTVRDATKDSPIGSKIPLIDMKRISPNTSPNDAKYSLPPLVSSKTESKSSEDSPDRIPITPPHHGSTWSTRTMPLPIKDSPVRAPDPEHLRAVWSQTSNKSELHPVNSLEGIADDLTALPFTLQDVKSEDGETPPPTMSTAPSRMSLHDVTKAFQQVPVSSSNPISYRPTISPPSTSAPVARPPQGFNYSVPPSSSSQNMRPNYPYHPSPIMSHSPAPMVYPHPMNGSPVPSRMQVNGHTPLFSPVWMPVPNAPGQTPGAMMRPAMPSSYPPPPMYPSPGPQPLYGLPPNMQNSPSAAQQGGHLNRGRGNGPMMSPAMAHAGAVPPMPMYGGSPVMLPAHAARPPMRNDNHPHHHPQHPPPSLHHPMQPQSYSSVPNPTPFGGVRPTW